MLRLDRLLAPLALVVVYAVARESHAQESSYGAVHAPPGFDQPPAGTAPPVSDRAEAPGDLAFDTRPRGEFGGYFMLVPGVEGVFANSSVGVSIGPAVAIGKRVRYHAALGFLNVAGGPSSKPGPSNGMHVEAATLGFPIVLKEDSIGIAIEPLVELFDWEWFYSSPDITLAWQSGFGIQGLVNYDKFYFALRPFNVQIRYLVYQEGTHPSGGLNWPVRLDAGMRF